MSKKETIKEAIQTVSLMADRAAIVEKLYEHLEDDEVIMVIKYAGDSVVFNSPVYEVYTDYGFIYIVVLNDEHTVEKYSAEDID